MMDKDMEPNVKLIEGGVTAAKGFKAAACYAGIGDDPEKGDLGLIYSEVPCEAAAVYTKNKVKAAHIAVMKKHLEDGKAQAVLCNSGNANTCTSNGKDIAIAACKAAGEALGIDPMLVMPASTGIIGVEMDEKPFTDSVPGLAGSLGADRHLDFARAIMTTDTVPKEAAVTFTAGGKECVLGACAKGSGMIHINMGTMLSFMATDLAITKELLDKALHEEILDSYNQVSIDGDTSTNDTLLIMASGLAGNTLIDDEKSSDYKAFREALHEISVIMARKIASDGEGASKLITVHVEGAESKETARTISSSVAMSDLVKTAVFGEDANWGRVLCSIGYAEADFSAENVDVDISSKAGSITVCRGSMATGFDEDEASKVMAEGEIIIEINMNSGNCEAYAWGCDLTYDYVKINGEYRT